MTKVSTQVILSLHCYIIKGKVSMKDEDLIKIMELLHSAVVSPLDVEVLCFLRNGKEGTSVEIAKALNKHRSSVHRSLKHLKNYKIVTEGKKKKGIPGRQPYVYRLKHDARHEILKLLTLR